MGLRLGELTAYLKINDRDFDRDLVKDQLKFRAAGKAMARDADGTGKAIGANIHHGASAGVDRFIRDANGRLHDNRGRFAREGAAMGEAAAQAAGGGLSALFGMILQLGGGVSAAAGPLKILAIVILGLAAAAMVAGPALGALTAVVATLPALAFGAAAGVTTLIFGFMGLADHFKKTAKAGGSVVDRAYQIAQAERRVRDANEEVLASQEALNRARADAAERMDDLNRSLAGSRLDKHAATLALADAQRELDAAIQTEDADQIERAQLAYDQAAQTLAEVTDRVDDLTREQQRNARLGVQGSDEVKSAMMRQRNAVEGVADAEHALREARTSSGGGGGAAEQLTKIAPAAQEAVDAIKALRPAWEKLRLSVQQKLFAGAAGELKDLSKAWLPTLRAKLGDTATTFNTIFKTFSSTAQKPEFIDKVGRALDGVNRFIEKIGTGLAGPFLDAMADLGEAAAPILDALGDDAGNFFRDFANWIAEGRKSGKLQEFLGKASDFLHDVLHMGKTVMQIVGDLVAILFGAEDNKVSSWQSLLNALDKLKEWLDDPANQKKAAEWIERFQVIGAGILKVVGFLLMVGVWLFDAERKFDAALYKIGVTVAGWVKGAKDKFGQLVDFIKDLPGKISSAAVGMFDGVRDAFRAALNWIIDRWNGLSFKLPKTSILGAEIGGGTLNTPDIPRLAAGAVVPATAGGRLVRVGEGGQAEAVIPLSKLGPMLRDAVMAALEAAGGATAGVIELTLDLGEGITKRITVALDKRDRRLARRVTARAGAR